MNSLTKLLKLAQDQHASDLHLSTNYPPTIRAQGKLISLSTDCLSAEKINTIIQSFGIENQEGCDFDGSLDYPEINQRLRVNVYKQTQGPAMAIRFIPQTIPTLETLQLPAQVKKFCALTKGLVLVTGATGSGKSTTLAAMIDHINTHEQKHIITIEDPIEFVYEPKLSLINQREIKKDTPSFQAALRSALRQDPDILLIGELRDLETIRLALTAAETGHLVLATLHTNSAPQAIERMINAFPGDEQNIIRTILAECLAGVMTQELKIAGGHYRAAMEILVSTPAIKNMIRENKTAQIMSVIQTGSQWGMQVMG